MKCFIPMRFVKENNIEIIYYPKFGGKEVYHTNELIGEWGGAELNLEVDEEGKYYYRLEIEYWDITQEE